MSKAKYVDGFVFLVPKKNMAAYKKMAQVGARAWMKHGALDYKECIGDDMRPKMAKLLFPKLTGAKAGDVVCFSYITFKSRKHRDQVNAKVMKQMEKDFANHKDFKMPFDENKMAYGGFEVLVDGKK